MRHNWTKEETIIAFNLYCKIPFKDCNKSHPLVVKYAQILGRTPSSLNMKIGNIGRLDPELKDKGISGLTHGAKMEQEVWDEFNNSPELLAYKSEELIARLLQQDLPTSLNIKDLPQGEEREVIIKQRVNQSFFRSAVMSSYNFTCCISGVNCPELVEACHILDWAKDKENRTNPKNGLCLNSLFHKAYDKNLLAITPDYEIVISERMLESACDCSFHDYLTKINGQKIILPSRFRPSKELLDIHYQQYKSI